MQSDKPADYLYKKLFHRSKYRGTKELDILIGAFAEQHLHSFSDDDLLLYEQIIDIEETILYNALLGKEVLAPQYNHHIWQKIYDFMHHRL